MKNNKNRGPIVLLSVITFILTICAVALTICAGPLAAIATYIGVIFFSWLTYITYKQGKSVEPDPDMDEKLRGLEQKWIGNECLIQGIPFPKDFFVGRQYDVMVRNTYIYEIKSYNAYYKKCGFGYGRDLIVTLDNNGRIETIKEI